MPDLPEQHTAPEEDSTGGSIDIQFPIPKSEVSSSGDCELPRMVTLVAPCSSVVNYMLNSHSLRWTHIHYGKMRIPVSFMSA